MDNQVLATMLFIPTSTFHQLRILKLPRVCLIQFSMWTIKINFKNTAINTELMIKSKIFDVKCIDIEGDELKRVGGESKRPIILHGINETLTILKFIPLKFTKKL